MVVFKKVFKPVLTFCNSKKYALRKILMFGKLSSTYYITFNNCKRLFPFKMHFFTCNVLKSNIHNVL